MIEAMYYMLYCKVSASQVRMRDFGCGISQVVRCVAVWAWNSWRRRQTQHHGCHKEAVVELVVLALALVLALVLQRRV